MSCAGRGAERVESDNYPTPRWCVRRMLEAAPWDLASHAWIHEPCAGEGAIVRELRDAYDGASITAWELRDTRVDLYKVGASVAFIGDSLKATWPTKDYGIDLVLTNPPFLLWRDFAERAIKCAQWTALLLRIGAAAHMTGLPTPSCYVLPDRPQFVALWKCAGHRVSGDFETCGWQEYRDPNESTRGRRCPSCGGKISRTASDGSEYAWFVWGPKAPSFEILASTPLHERKGLVPEAAA